VFFMHKIMSSVNRDSLISSLPICIPFISYSFLIVLARNFKSRLNMSRESEYPCLIPNLKTSVFNFSPLSMMLATGLSYAPLLC
jgi:hypothetical protein